MYTLELDVELYMNLLEEKKIGTIKRYTKKFLNFTFGTLNDSSI